jgi:hypothetical protein
MVRRSNQPPRSGLASPLTAQANNSNSEDDNITAALDLADRYRLARPWNFFGSCLNEVLYLRQRRRSQRAPGHGSSRASSRRIRRWEAAPERGEAR